MDSPPSDELSQATALFFDFPVIENGDGESNKPNYTKPPETKRPKELDGYVGFANLPNQVYRKAVKKGFEFTLMIVGESLSVFVYKNFQRESVRA